MDKNIILQVELEELQRKLKEKPLEYKSRSDEISRSMDSLELFMDEKDLDHKFLSRQLARLEDQLQKDRKNLERVDSYREGKEGQVISLRREIEAESLLSRQILKRKVVSDKELLSKENELEGLRGELKSLRAVDLNIRAAGQKIMEKFADRISGWDLLEGNMKVARMPQEDMLQELGGAIRERIYRLKDEASESKASLQVILGRSKLVVEKITRLTEKLKKEQKELQGCLAEREELKRSIEKSETRLIAVSSFQERIDKLNAGQAMLKKEYTEWHDLEKPLIEARIVEIQSALERTSRKPVELKKTEGVEKKAEANKSVVMELMPRIEERLEKQVREKFDDLDKQHKELVGRIQEEEADLKKDLSEKLKLEEENKRKDLHRKLEEEEKSLREAIQARLFQEGEKKLQEEIAAKFKLEEENKRTDLNRKLEEEEKSLKEALQARLFQEEERLRAEITEKIESEKKQLRKPESKRPLPKNWKQACQNGSVYSKMQLKRKKKNLYKD